MRGANLPVTLQTAVTVFRAVVPCLPRANMQTRNISCHGLPPPLRETGEEKLGPAQLRGSGGSSVGSGGGTSQCW